MEVRRAADMLLRTNSSLLANFLAPATNVRCATQQRILSGFSHPVCLNRNFVTSSRNQAARPDVTTSTAPPPLSSESSLENTTGTSIKSEADSIAKQLWTAPSSRPSPFAPRASPFSAAKKPTNTAYEMLDFLNSHKSTQSRMDTSKMSDPFSANIPGQSPAEQELMESLNMDLDLSVINNTTHKIPMRLNPSTGRNVPVTGSVDLGRAFLTLERSCQQNRVRADLNRQRFHERPGLKRKRLRRERWRKRFGQGFQATVLRVKQLKNQGW
ncbi:hypothetical protein BGZ60DRAFT_419135 [Tricladium varicosporioides]|nr:hypothetical protein BGZ60DRAFT_419135 [Hymenoscyphus varicosporioides]